MVGQKETSLFFVSLVLSVLLGACLVLLPGQALACTGIECLPDTIVRVKPAIVTIPIRHVKALLDEAKVNF